MKIPPKENYRTTVFSVNGVKYEHSVEFALRKTQSTNKQKKSLRHLKTNLQKDPLNKLPHGNLGFSWRETASLLDFCLSLGIFVPHYCYHKQLSIAGNCRMCLIELKKSPKPVVSCSINAKSTLIGNTEVFTNSPLVKKSRENIMEFLLLNHPLDCPICDQGGECDLQDQSLFFGFTKKRFYNYKRVVTDKNLGHIVKTVMTRCIHCTRCVRFATEIAGVEDIGVFGRGINSEIGTYINKTFQSELSGNIVDLCPVGALTFKPYPFAGRSWEFKKIKTIDISDGYGSEILVFLKNGSITKVLSGYDSSNTDNLNLWISDKTRFLFDSLVSIRRNIGKTTDLNEKYPQDLVWYSLFTKLVVTIYLHDHLQKHCLNINQYLIMFDETSSVEVMSILLLIEKKYSFFQLKRANKIKVSNDFQSSFKLNCLRRSNMLDSSTTCLLLSTNTRYESPYLNLKLKKRYSSGNFRTFSISSRTDLTFPSVNIGSNVEKLGAVVEGNNNTGHCFKKSKNFLALLSTEVLERQDSFAIINFFKALNLFCSKAPWFIFNLLSTSLNSVGINNLHSFKNLCKTDLNKNNGLFFINNGLRTSLIINKFMELSLLNHTVLDINTQVIIEQNYKSMMLSLSNNLNAREYIYLPSVTFFENSGSYVNTEGNTKWSTKLISSTHDTKDDWVILRKLISVLDTVEFTCDIKNNTRIQYNGNSLFNFKNLISFLFVEAQNLSRLAFYKRATNQSFIFMATQQIKKLKVRSTQLKKWIEDFYLGGSDNYTHESKTMNLCSMSMREIEHTFSGTFKRQIPQGFVSLLG